MAATKEAVIAKGHHPELEPTIFFLDLGPRERDLIPIANGPNHKAMFVISDP